MLALFALAEEKKEENVAKYIEENHTEILAYIKLIIATDHKNALYILHLLTKNGYALDYAEELVPNFSQYRNADIQERYLLIIFYLLSHDHAIDVAIPFMQNVHGASCLNTDNSKLIYIGALVELVQKGKACTLAETIINDLISSENIQVQCNLIKLLIALVKQGQIPKNIDTILQHFARYNHVECVADALEEIRKELIYYDCKVLIRKNQESEAVDVKYIVESRRDSLRDFFVEAMSSGSYPQKKHDALQVAAILATKQLMFEEIESALTISMQDASSEFSASSLYLLSILVEHTKAHDLAKRIVTTLSKSIQQQNVSIQINYLSILVSIWREGLLEVAQNAIMSLANSQEHDVLRNVYALLSALIRDGNAPSDVQKALQALKQSSFDDIREDAEKLEAELGTSTAE